MQGLAPQLGESPFRMKALVLAPYSVEFAATRYRLTQFVAQLSLRGIQLTIRSFLNFLPYVSKLG